ncbi:MAG: glycerophosphodiester phosphodiesterase [Saprospiraceae bacterium]
MKNIFLLIISLSVLNACVPEQDAIEQNPYKIEKGDVPWIIAHGGSKHLFPENTMIAFQGSADIGVDALEMDVTMTKDEVLVTHHDLTIDRMSNGTGNVIDYTFDELLQFNFGYNFQDIDGNFPYKNDTIGIPVSIGKLEDVFTTFQDYQFMVELKDRGEDGKRAAEILKEMIEQFELQDKIVVVAFSEETLNYFHEITNGEILIGTSEEETKDFVFTGLSAMEFLYRPEASVVAIPTENSNINLATKRIINSAHRRNMAVHYWTINDKTTMKDLIEKGADGLITDRPDLMQEVLIELGF